MIIPVHLWFSNWTKVKMRGQCYNDEGWLSAFLALKHGSRILRHSSNPECGYSMMEQVRLCDVLPTENWLGSSLYHKQGWTTVWESYSRALEQGPLLNVVLFPLLNHPQDCRGRWSRSCSWCSRTSSPSGPETRGSTRQAPSQHSPCR